MRSRDGAVARRAAMPSSLPTKVRLTGGGSTGILDKSRRTSVLYRFAGSTDGHGQPDIDPRSAGAGTAALPGVRPLRASVRGRSRGRGTGSVARVYKQRV